MHVENAGNKACSLHQYILSVYVYVCCGQLSGGQSHTGIYIATPPAQHRDVFNRHCRPSLFVSFVRQVIRYSIDCSFRVFSERFVIRHRIDHSVIYCILCRRLFSAS